MKSVYSKTLYQKRTMAIGWMAGLSFVMFITMSVYNSFSDGNLAQSLQNVPPALEGLVGDIASFKTVDGYISQQIFALRAPLLLTILSIAILVGVSGGEEEKGLLETQLALPIGRSKLLLQKLAAGLTVITVASLGIMLGVSVAVLLIRQEYNLLEFLQHLSNCVLVAGCYGLIGFTVASATGKRGLALGAASGLAFLSFLINSMAPSVSFFDGLDKLTLFHYYHFKGNFNWPDTLLLVGTAMALVLISLFTFNRRDIRAR